ncbi:4-diphosphocytidyl-2C-methyl-D-erythritol kinase [Bosea sp. PAMC 26642]|nr:4-diphosphocytidyl-2C-methyl-D-erythritol kinase [Bosea sp. PAMC 26642]
MTTRARAKVNLTLAVRGRRADGYHDLESLVVFAGTGDTLTLEPGPELGLTIGGPKGQGLESDEGNLVLRAARALADELGPLQWGRFHLVKRLPVASGIGGGSADAAGALRLLARLNGLSLADSVLQRVALKVGADVPVCLESRARIMSGIGEQLGPPLRLPPLFAVLVNPGVPVATMAVFRELALPLGSARDHAPTDWAAHVMDRDGLIAALRSCTNDLQAPATRVAPVLEPLLHRLAELPGCRLARMSGSGATCLALFDDCRTSAAAAKTLARDEPGWWVKATVLR